LPKIPPYHPTKESSKVSELLNTSLPSTPLKLETQEDLDVDNKAENRKSKPKALEFWESMTETVDRTDFRYYYQFHGKNISSYLFFILFFVLIIKDSAFKN
jgi:hypothetical protein